MDPQQELFSALLVELRKKYKDTGTGVYDTFLPPEGTPDWELPTDNQCLAQQSKTAWNGIGVAV